MQSVRGRSSSVTVGASTKRFTEKVDPVRLFSAARAELESQHPEQFRAFVLCTLAGLRRSEADRLSWAQIDLGGRTIAIERTEWFEPKSEESARHVDLDPIAVEILRHAKNDNPDPIFVLKGAAPHQQLKASPTYRCDAAPWHTWERLIVWLPERESETGSRSIFCANWLVHWSSSSMGLSRPEDSLAMPVWRLRAQATSRPRNA
jgi:integrase